MEMSSLSLCVCAHACACVHVCACKSEGGQQVTNRESVVMYLGIPQCPSVWIHPIRTEDTPRHIHSTWPLRIVPLMLGVASWW